MSGSVQAMFPASGVGDHSGHVVRMKSDERIKFIISTIQRFAHRHSRRLGPIEPVRTFDTVGPILLTDSTEQLDFVLESFVFVTVSIFWIHLAAKISCLALISVYSIM